MYSKKGWRLSQQTCEFILLCFEGPDEYSIAGGLGVRVSELARSLAEDDYAVHLTFMGDPHLPYEEEKLAGKLRLYRWAQWVSKYYPNGVYDGEEAKLSEFSRSVPSHIVALCNDVISRGKIPIVLAEDWHTAEPLCAVSDMLHYSGQRHQVILLWNANNTAGFERINFSRLNFCSTLLTVSRFMKHEMWKYGVNPIVVPNGIPARLVDEKRPEKEASKLRKIWDDGLSLFKIGRFSPDKRWMMAIEALGELVRRNMSARLIMRGGIEPHGGDVLERARHLGLNVVDIHLSKEARDLEHLIDAIKSSPDAHIYNLTYFVPEEVTRVLNYAVDAVLANSGFEPFGLVGLEVMAAGGVAVTGATGEDYARNGFNALVVETNDSWELAVLLQGLLTNKERSSNLRNQGRETAKTYVWKRVNEDLVDRATYVAQKQGLLHFEPIQSGNGVVPDIHSPDHGSESALNESELVVSARGKVD